MKAINLRYFGVALGAALVALGLWAVRIDQPLLANLEGQMVDAQLRLRGPLPPQAPISILMIDDRSLEEIGTLPIDRRLIAQAVDRLKQEGAALTVFDMLFVERSRRDAEADQVLAAAIARAGNVVLPYALSADGQRNPAQATSAVPDFVLNSAFAQYRNEERRRYIPLQPQRMLAPLPALASGARAFGHVSALPGGDGSLRYDFPALWFEDELYPSLALTVARLVAGKAPDVALGESLTLGERRVPLDLASRQWVNYYGASGVFPTYSFADYIAGRLPKDLMRGRIVLIGDTALGNSDRHPSAFDPALPGVERMATVIDNLLTGRWLSRPAWAPQAELAGMVLLPLVVVGMVLNMVPALALTLAVGLAVLVFAVAQGLLATAGLHVSVGFPLLALLLAGVGATALRAWEDERSRRRAEVALRASEERYALAAKGANDGLWDWNIASGEVFYSQRWRQLMEVEGDASLKGLEAWTDLLDQVERERFRQELEAHLAGRSGQFYHIIRHEGGENTRWLLARGVAVHEHGKPARMAGSLTDITEQKRLEKQIAFDAWHDRLTQLPNRDLFNERLGQWLSQGMTVGVVLVDIDGFRGINEQHGQVAGNNLLGELARRLRQGFDERYLVARLGADQFALAYEGELSQTVPQAVMSLLQAPFNLGEVEEPVGATLALAHTSQGLESADELINAATLTLAHGKQSSRGQIRQFDPAEQALETSRRWLHENIDKALAAGDQFKLFYQPFIRLSDRALLGFEALIRWQHPEKGFIFPNDFIPFAEESGQINAIGRWTLHQAARDLVSWESLGFQGEVAVNLSGRQFSDMDLPAECAAVIGALGTVATHRYKLEVTESMAMSNPQRATDTLQVLAGMGFKISIDDFGTGYSSLAYLHRFPFDTLKVDRSFVIRLDSGAEAREIVRTIASLGGALGKQVLAEGVEDENQAQVLASLGVQVGQGWLFAKALPYDQATEFIRKSLSE